jgi:phage-related protein
MVFNLVANDAASSAFDKLARNVELSNAAIDRHNAAAAASTKTLDDNGRAVDRNNDSLARMSGTLTTTSHGFGLLATAAVAFGPAIGAAAAVATAGIIGLGGIVTSTGAALGVFGLTAKSQFDGLSKGYQNIQKLKEAAAAAPAGSKEQAADYAKLAQAQAEYTKTFGPAAAGMNNLQNAWTRWKTATSGQTNEILAKGLNLVADALPKLRPLFDTGAAAAGRFLDAIKGWVSGGGMDRAVNLLNNMAKAVMPPLEQAMRNIAKAAGDLAPLFAVFAVNVANGLAHITGAFASWVASNGASAFQTFMNFLRTNGPAVWALLKNLADAAVNIARALAPLAPVSLAIANALAKLIAAAPPVVIQAAAVAFVAYSVGMKVLAVWAPIVAVATKGWAAAQWLLNVAMTANPIGLIVIAIAALAAALYLAWTRSAAFRVAIEAAWNGLRAAAGVVASAIVAAWQSVVTFFSGVGTSIIGVFNGIKNFITSSFNTWWASNGEAIKQIWNNVWNSVADTVRTIWAVISPIIQVGITVIRTAIQAGMAVIQAVWSASWSVISTAVQIAWGVIQAIFQAGIAVVSAAWNLFWSVLGNVLKVVWAGIEAVIKVAWDVIVGIFTIAISLLTGHWNAAWVALQNMATQVWNAIVAFFRTTWAAIQGIFDAAAKFIEALLSAAWNLISSVAQTIWNAIWAFFAGWINTFKTNWTAAIGWIEQALSAAWSSISATAISVWNAIWAFFANWINTFKSNWTATISWVEQALSAAWNSISATAQAVWNAIWAFFAGWINTFKTNWTATISWVEQALSAAWSSISATATSTWNAIWAFFSGWITNFKNSWTAAIGWLEGALSAAWSSIQSTASTAWNAIVGAIKTAISAIGNAIRAPIEWVIETPLNGGIIKGFNIISSVVNGPHINDIPHIPTVPAFRSGIAGFEPPNAGIRSIPGYGGGDKHLALLEAGESVVPKELTPALAGWLKAHGVPGYATGMVSSAQVFALAQSSGIPSLSMTSGYRPGGTSAHAAGTAADIASWDVGSTDPNTPMNKLYQWISSKYHNSFEVIHWPYGGIKQGKDVSGSFWPESVWLQHKDHVHWAIDYPGFTGGAAPGILGQIGNVIGGVVRTAEQILSGLGTVGMDLFNGNIGAAVSYLLGKTMGGNPAQGLLKDLLTKIPNFLADKAANFLSNLVKNYVTGQQGASASTSSAGSVTAGAGETSYITAMLADMGAPATAANIQSILAWSRREFPSWPPAATWNLMATTQAAPGATNFNSVGVKNYPDPTTGARANAQTLLNGLYPNIVADLRSGKGLIGQSNIASELLKWSGGGYSSLDQGGWLPPGRSLVVNNTGGYEKVLPPGGDAALTAELRALRSQMAELIRITAAVPAATGAHVGGAINGSAGRAGFRNRYPVGGS